MYNNILVRIALFSMLPSWLFWSCNKESNTPIVPEVINYNNLSGHMAFSRSLGKIMILNGNMKSDTILSIKNDANIWDASVSLSSNGENITYSAVSDEGYQVFKMSVRGRNNLKLTKSLSGFVEHYTSPVWSSDDEQIFYVANGLIILGPVFSIKYDGTDLKQVTDFDVYRRVSVSKDKSFIICASGGSFGPGIYLYDIINDLLKPLKEYDSDYTAYSPVLSPDEKKVAFVLRHGFNEQGISPYFFRIITININGTEEMIIKELPFERYVNDTYVTWSPDGTKLAFNYGSGINGDQGSHIFIINSDGTGITQVTNNTDYDGAPSWIN